MNLVLALALSISQISLGQNATQVVRISNLGRLKGELYIGWYKDASTFRVNEKAIYREKIIVNNQSEVRVVFKNIPNEKYAIAVFLDQNGNYKLDKNIVGIPKEKYGFSNNVLPALRPATFKESVFEVQKETEIIDIRLK